MPTLVIVDIHVTDPETYEQYKMLASQSIGRYGGRYLVRGGEAATLEGRWQPGRLVVLEFPSAERARAWWSSPEYAEARQLRLASATAEMVLADGPSYDPPAP